MAEKTVEQYYLPPPKVGRWEGFRTFLWNSETHQFLGRTGASWAKILLFYVLFYASLTGFFFAMLAIFYQTIDLDIPKWQLDESLIGSNPGLGFRPMPPEENVESTLIWYNQKDDNWKYWTNQLDVFLKEYTEENPNRVHCDFGEEAPPGKICDVDITSFHNCTSATEFGYARAQPCIFLKLNKIFNWRPTYYNATSGVAEGMPKELKSLVHNVTNADSRKDYVWVSCEGENPADVENMGDLEYIPAQGFASYYFPFRNTKGYLSPLVAIRFVRPKTGVLINIECKAWAKNIFHDRAERRGSVHFELMVD
ncbi:hypothetical protein R5R35_008414 [Gryllus longicercus]|uniref:Sodium/potassium-transporting ATPase subunit beta-2 n=1 Tax=Gryllus longicercus TaxID=2509291 RepID=A0AAN9VKS7_9ORTH